MDKRTINTRGQIPLPATKASPPRLAKGLVHRERLDTSRKLVANSILFWMTFTRLPIANRASHCYAQHGYWTEAVTQAIAIGNLPLAVKWIDPPA